MTTRTFRIHGDNIVECQRTLAMIEEALSVNAQLDNSPLYSPVYSFEKNGITFLIQLLAGHGRWGATTSSQIKKFDIGELVIKNGGILRESADSYISEVTPQEEKVLLGIEYCSALPAGNNAWQRNGRAMSSILAGIPYLYFAEIGGAELKENRTAKASRFPNPVVPFSYIAFGKTTNVFCLPIYRPHPSITPSNYKKFEDIFGYEESLKIISSLILNEDCSNTINSLSIKTLRLVKKLSADRRTNDTFKGLEWDLFLDTQNRADFAIQENLEWKKKSAGKVKVSDTFRALQECMKTPHIKTVGAKEIPICLIPKRDIEDFQILLDDLYPQLDIKLNPNKHLAVLWVTGFKPQGDDSRPDRGLSSLSKMILGDSCDTMAVVYGPAKTATWESVKSSLSYLASSNGLWQSIINVCNYMLLDSATLDSPIFRKLKPKRLACNNTMLFPAIKLNCLEYSEHDTDTAIRQILNNNKYGIFEGLCNPPGGDWSGISFILSGIEYRWTSLPRVSAVRGKRPDHVFQVLGKKLVFLSIESKGYGRNLEKGIGDNLRKYLAELFLNPPTCSNKVGLSHWRAFTGDFQMPEYEIVTIGAFLYKNLEELSNILASRRLDVVMGFEFGEKSIVHVLTSKRGLIFVDIIKETTISKDRLEIAIY